MKYRTALIGAIGVIALGINPVQAVTKSVSLGMWNVETDLLRKSACMATAALDTSGAYETYVPGDPTNRRATTLNIMVGYSSLDDRYYLSLATYEVGPLKGWLPDRGGYVIRAGDDQITLAGTPAEAQITRDEAHAIFTRQIGFTYAGKTVYPPAGDHSDVLAALKTCAEVK